MIMKIDVKTRLHLHMHTECHHTSTKCNIRLKARPKGGETHRSTSLLSSALSPAGGYAGASCLIMRPTLVATWSMQGYLVRVGVRAGFGFGFGFGMGLGLA